jgi:release factor glutamine methyltransferase
MTIQQVLQSKKIFKNMAPLDRELLLSCILKKSKEYLFTYPEKKLSAVQIKNLSFLAKKRLKGEPIAYILGKKEFFGLEFDVNKNVLIPRPETELLVELALKKILDPQFSILNSCVIDVGTGSGNIIISLIKNTPQKTRKKISFGASDISKRALLIAKKNARKHRIAKYIKFIHSDLLEFLLKKKTNFEKMLIVANLPYISSKLYRKNSRNLKYEPKTALISQKNGLGYYLKLLDQIKQLCVSTKYGLQITVYFEINPGQKRSLQRYLKQKFPRAKINFFKDLSGKSRTISIEIEKTTEN